MKKLILLPLVGLVTILSSCFVGPHGRVYPIMPPIVFGVPGPVVIDPAFYGAPYWVCGDIRYYNWNGHYCYYDHGHRVFVEHVPHEGHAFRNEGHHRN